MRTSRVGLLLAAGRGRRLGGVKQLRPWPPAAPTTTMIAAAFDSIAEVAGTMIVVVGHDRDAVVAALEPREFVPVDVDPDGEMFASICAGFRRAPSARAILLQPGDHPSLHPATLARLISAAGEDRVIIPTWKGRGGHPALIGAELIPMILGSSVCGGLGQWFREHSELVVRIPVDDPGVVRDIDSPGDL